MLSVALFVAVGISAVSAQNCPEPEGTFYWSDSTYCDRYTQCRDGVVTEEICPDGLLFNDLVTNGRYPCDLPVEVDCGSRNQVQPAVPTQNCDHQNGYFGSRSATACDVFFNCVGGREHQFNCPEGLAFSSSTLRCEWPDESPDCDSATFLGVSCPDPRSAVGPITAGLARIAHANDCLKYYVCVGTSPRLHACSYGTVFNTDIDTCDDFPEQVRGCENYYTTEELAFVRKQAEERRLRAQKRQEAAAARLLAARRQ